MRSRQLSGQDLHLRPCSHQDRPLYQITCWQCDKYHLSCVLDLKLILDCHCTSLTSQSTYGKRDYLEIPYITCWSCILNENSVHCAVYNLTLTALESINMAIPFLKPRSLPFVTGSPDLLHVILRINCFITKFEKCKSDYHYTNCSCCHIPAKTVIEADRLVWLKIFIDDNSRTQQNAFGIYVQI
jgi:hypothetical protein